jgi:4-amino-4-deoxy-L-arabinose transferase-like glycosyltransferase
VTRDQAVVAERRWQSPAALMLIAFLVGLGLRLLCLGCKSLWLDEAISVKAASATLAALWAGKVDPQHPPLYYMLLHYWIRLGTSEFTLRLSSALAGAAHIPVVYVLARRLASTSVAISASWLAALSPLLVWYSQELRNYSFLTLLALLIGVVVVNLCTQPRAGWWLLLVASMTAALYMHHIAVVLLPAQALLVIVLRMQRRLQRTGVLLWLAAFPATLLLYWPWLRQPAATAFWRAPLTGGPDPVVRIAQFLGLPAGLAIALGASLVLAGMCGAILLAYIYLGQDAERLERWRRGPGLRVALFVLMLAATVITVIPRVYTIKKAVVTIWPYGLILIAWFWPWQAACRRALALLLAASLAGAVINVAVVPKDQWRDAVRYLEENKRPDDGLWLQPYYSIVPFNYYAHGALPAGKPDVTGGQSALAEQAARHTRLWYLYSARGLGQEDAQQMVPAWLEANLRLLERREWHGLRLELYEHKE